MKRNRLAAGLAPRARCHPRDPDLHRDRDETHGHHAHTAGFRSRAVTLIVLLALLPGLLFAQGGPAKKVKEIEVDVLNGLGWGGCYRPREWTPVLVGIGLFIR